MSDTAVPVAVLLRQVNFCYGNGNDNSLKHPVLRNFGARILYGQIYALLGPSGGGKTTALKIILGRLKPQTGTVMVLGVPAGHANAHISFMPQEMGLCEHFTINQTLRYFKLIYQISNEDFYIRRRELTTLMQLPDGHMLVRNLSGGTKRRLSIVVAMINNPTLVILDEPTVGIDALLRHQIWNYLLAKTQEGMTMIIVTHYIEEAAQAHRVGLMRHGRLLAEGNPQQLMAVYKQPDLEAVFLKLCCLDDDDEDRRLVAAVSTKDPPPPSSLPEFYYDGDEFECGSSTSASASFTTTSTTSSAISSLQTLFNVQLFKIKFWIIMTLVYRNAIKFLYSYFSLIIVLLPATQALIFCLATSKDITHLPAAVVDKERDPEYGKAFINQLKTLRGFAIQPRYYRSVEEAEQAMREHQVIGTILIPENYTESIEQRIEDGFAADNGTVQDSTIRVILDNSYYILSNEFYTSLLESFGDFSRNLFRAKDLNMLEIPIAVEKTRLSRNYRFNDYFMPGYFLLFLYISQITMASLALTQERKDGLFERSLVAGVTHELVFLSHIVTSLFISIVQLFLLDLIAFQVFENPSNASYWLKFSLFLMESLNAMSLGFVISSLIDSEAACLVLVWFVSIPQCLSSGVLWPLESVAKPFHYLFYLWPLSVPVNTIRHIMLQGWDLSNINVRYGFLSSGLPMLLFFYIALLIFKHR